MARFLHYRIGTQYGCIRLNRGESEPQVECWPGAPGGAPGFFYVSNLVWKIDLV